MTDRTLYVIQQEAGDDGLYHWKLFLARPNSTTSGTWHDVVWSDDKDVGMKHRGPYEFSEAKSRRMLKLWEIGHVTSANASKVDQVCSSTRTPKYDVADKDKNCQTWIYDVVHTLIRDGVLSQSAIAMLDKVPKEED